MKFVVVESLLLAGLLSLSAFVFFSTLSLEGLFERAWVEPLVRRVLEYASGEMLLAVLTVVLTLAFYWALQLSGRGRRAFWLVALLVILLHAPAIWGHNQLEINRFLGVFVGLEAVHSQLLDSALFLATLIGLVALLRVAGLRLLNRQLSSQEVEALDRSRVIASETLMLIGLVTWGLARALLMILVPTWLAKSDTLMAGSPRTILIVGGAAVLLFALTLVLWFHRRENVEFTTAESNRSGIIDPRQV